MNKFKQALLEELEKYKLEDKLEVKEVINIISDINVNLELGEKPEILDINYSVKDTDFNKASSKE